MQRSPVRGQTLESTLETGEIVAGNHRWTRQWQNRAESNWLGVMTMATAGRSGFLLEVAELVQRVGEQHVEVDTVLGELTKDVVRSVPGAEYAGITVVLRDRQLRSASASGEYPVLLDEIQQRHGQGPCLLAATEQRTIRISDMATERRWPLYSREVAATTPIRSVMSFHLCADHQTTGVLNFYSETANVFDDDAAQLGETVATLASLVWNLACREEQFRAALASRDIIGQAKGMVMERFKIGAGQAFELLKRLSQSSNTPLVAVARQLVDSENYAHDRSCR
jgi:transcriptional regulator with GAF, ATPase, and Fis domain